MVLFNLNGFLYKNPSLGINEYLSTKVTSEALAICHSQMTKGVNVKHFLLNPDYAYGSPFVVFITEKT
jgi:hypothetical protein